MSASDPSASGETRPFAVHNLHLAKAWRAVLSSGPKFGVGHRSLPSLANPLGDEEEIRGGGKARDPLTGWRAVAKRTFTTVGIFSVFVNVLMLTLPLYLFQLSDRVLTSRSLDTLLMLSLLAIAFLAVLSLVDIFRRQMLGALANRFVSIIGGPLVASVIRTSHIGGGNVQAVRSLNQVRNFISSPTMLLLFDAPLSPLYFAVLFLINLKLGVVALLSGLLLTATAVLNQRATSERLARAGAHSLRADDHAEALARNSQAINAMGMLNESILLWGREQAHALSWQISALNRNFWISGASKFFRLITQIAVLGYGAYLAINGEITGGMMIAASITGAARQRRQGPHLAQRQTGGVRAARSGLTSASEQSRSQCCSR